MLTIDTLRAFGADVETGLRTCMNNEAFYLRLVGMSLDDKNYEKLRDAIAQNDLAAAFEAAHALKGVLSNLWLTPLVTQVSELTELLRHREPGDYAGYVENILALRDRLAELRAD